MGEWVRRTFYVDGAVCGEISCIGHWKYPSVRVTQDSAWKHAALGFTRIEEAKRWVEATFAELNADLERAMFTEVE